MSHTKVSEAQREASTERTRRITAEQAAKAAKDAEAAAVEAAEQAMAELDDARTRFEAEVERIRAEAAREGCAPGVAPFSRGDGGGWGFGCVRWGGGPTVFALV